MCIRDSFLTAFSISSPAPLAFPKPENCCRVVPFTWHAAMPVVAVAYTPVVPASASLARMRVKTKDFPVPAHPATERGDDS